RLRRTGYDRQLGQAPQHEAVAMAPVELVALAGEADLGEAHEERSQGDLSLHPRERCAEAVMDPVPERQMAAFGPLEVEPVGSRVAARVAVGGGDADEHLRTRRDRPVAE